MKRLLFIGSNKNFYVKHMIAWLEAHDYQVDYVDELLLQTKYTLYFKMIWKLRRYDLMKRHNDRLLTRQLKRLKASGYDKIFVLRGSNLNESHISFLKARYPDAEYILYLWDPLNRYHNRDVLVKSFDRYYSFDSNDCRQYGMAYHPTFYVYSDEQINPMNERKYDICFIGTEFSDRFDRICELRKACEERGVRYKIALVTSYLPYLKGLLNLDKKRHDNLDLMRVRFLPYEKFIKNISESRCVLDLTHPTQCGISSRTFETLALGTKLISNNKYILEEKDLPRDAYMLIKEDTEMSDILNFAVEDTPAFKVSEKYSLDGFMKVIFQ